MNKIVQRYLISGILFGCCFPLIGILVDMILVKDLTFSITHIGYVHEVNPIHYIIDLAPIVLGIVFAYLGFKQSKVEDLNDQLKATLTNRESIIDTTSQQLRYIESIQSHIVRKPVANLISPITLLKMTEMSSTQQEIIEKMEESSAELDSEIKKILETTRQ